ncbi:TonB-dependent receptor [Sulfurimonas sp. MAG313]|nr:TonB-dependent receptor [Sulfurimonas sp. MAG313]MDF1879755.1 TonB-dependent receptor [Sulfurimonas sp. MAG313]
MKKIQLGLISAIYVSSAFGEVINLAAVSVTGLREEQRVLDQALSISTKEKKEIKLDQVIFQKDLLNSIAGVNVIQTSSGIGHMLSIRTPISTQPYFLILQDGIPVQSSGFFNHNSLAYTNFESASSTEVLKGAGTALYGSDAVAATVNIQSQAPSQISEAMLRLKGGADGYASGYVEQSDTIDEKSSYRIGGGYTHNDGWREHTTYDRVELMGRYDTMINDENLIKINLTANKTEAQQAGTLDSLDELENNAQSVGNIQDIIDQGYDPKRKFDFARLSVEWDNYSFENLEISTITYLRTNRNRYTATWENNLPTNDSKEKTLGLMQKNTYDHDYGKLILGFDTEFTKSNRTYTQEFDFVPSRWGSPVEKGTIYDYDINYFAFSPYAHTDWNLGEHWLLGAGLRYDTNNFDYTNKTDNGQYTESDYFRPSDTSDSFSHLSPKLSLSYKANKSMNIYLRYANGFRIPQASRLYALKTNNSDFSLEPEISDTYEFGLKKVYQNHSLEVAMYYMTIDDTITRRENPDTGDRYYENGETSTHKGIELTYSGKLTKEISTKVAYSYTKHNFKNDIDYGNNEQEAAPNHLANARVFYEPSFLRGLIMMAEWQYLSSYWMDNTNLYKYSGYSIANIKGDYEFSKHLSFFAKINNITDVTYAEKASFAYGTERYTPAAPMQAFAGLEYKW